MITILLVLVLLGYAIFTFLYRRKWEKACAIHKEGEDRYDKRARTNPLYEKYTEHRGNLEFSIMLSIVIVLFFGGGTYYTASVNQSKIDFLREDMSKFESEIALVVSNYSDFEKDVFDRSGREMSATLLVETYPELKTSELIQRQLDVYESNREAVRKMEMRAITNKFWQKVWFPWKALS